MTLDDNFKAIFNPFNKTKTFLQLFMIEAFSVNIFKNQSMHRDPSKGN